MLETILGQGHVKKVLHNLCSSERIPFGMLFYGPSLVGKFETALALARSFNCKQSKEDVCNCSSCKKIRSGFHPDVKIVEPNEKGRILIDTIRDVVEVFKYKLHEGRRKVCVIRKAHLMNSQAANALLKVLEEPKGDTTLILTSSNRGVLLDTIRSRCQLVRFSFLGDKDLLKVCTRNRVDVTDVELQMMGGMFNPSVIMDRLEVLDFLWSKEQPVLDSKMKSEPLIREFNYLGSIITYMLQHKLSEFRSVYILRSNVEKLRSMLEAVDTAVYYLSVGIRPILVLKSFESKVKPIIG